MGDAAVSVFVSYVREDEGFLRALETQLAPLRTSGKIALWSGRALSPGEDERKAALEQLGAADVIVLLLSPDYLADEDVVREMAAALRKREAEHASIAPVLVRPCLVEETPLGRLRALPENGEPISTWANQDLAWLSVVKGLRPLLTSHVPARGRALAPMLPQAPVFVGRDAQADEVTEALLASPSQPVVLLGGPGIGKTTLSIAVVRRAEVAKRFGARRVFARLDGATTGEAALAKVATAAGLPPSTELRAALLAWLAEAPALVVLDNLETPHATDREGTEALIAWLAEQNDIAILASVRGGLRPGGATWKAIELRPLRPPHDVELFCKLAQEHETDRAAVTALVSPLGGVPLAIALLALAAQGNSLVALRMEWEARRTATLDQGGTGAHASWAACVDVSFRSPRMTAEAERLCRVLALLPEGAAVEDLPSLLPAPAVAAAAARVLAHVGLAYFENGRLRMLPPLRHHVRAARPVEATDRARAADHYRVLAKTLGPRAGSQGGREAVEGLAPEWANVEELLGEGIEAEGPAQWIDTAVALADFIRFSGLGTPEPLERALRAAQSSKDTAREADCIRRLGDIALARSEHEQARARYEAALPLYRQVGSVLGETNCIQCLGDIALARSEHEQARARYEAALPLYRQVGSVLGEANCIQCLGDIALERSEHEQARTRYEAALPLFRQVGSVLGEASCIKRLGDIALARSEHEQARTRYEAALPLYRQVGSVLGEASCIQRLGDIALARSGHEQARARYEAALPLFRQVGSLLGEANCIKRLGDIALERSEHEQARARYEAALPLFRKVGALLGEANCIQRLGDIALERLEHESARTRYESALPLYRQVGDVLGEANCIQRLGDIALACSEHEPARGRYEAALPLFRQVGSVLGEANCIQRLGDIALERSEHEPARARYEAALPLYRQVGYVLGEANCIQRLGDIALERSEHEPARAWYEAALSLYARIPEPYSMGMTHRRLARLAPADADRRRHVAAARQLWTQIDRPDLVAQLDAELP
jgi:tetratricopeptide (TPR) repeat protein